MINHLKTILPVTVFCLSMLAHDGFTEAAKVSHKILCTDYKGDRVVIISTNGEIEWEYPAKTPQDCWLLPNGNVLFSRINGAAEVTMDKREVWAYFAPTNAQVHSCQPLPNGNVLVGEGVTSRIVQVNRVGQVVKVLPIKSKPEHLAHQMRGVRRTADGHYWICLMDEKKIVELAPDGSLLREISCDGHPLECVKLPDGHLLVTMGEPAHVVEWDEHLKVIWEITADELPGNPLRLPVGIQRLPNGNTVIGNYLDYHGTQLEGTQPMAVEVTPDKQVVWELFDKRFRTVCQLQVLDVPANAANGEVLR